MRPAIRSVAAPAARPLPRISTNWHGLTIAFIVGVGGLFCNTVEEAIAFAAVAIAALLPSLLWLRRGAPGIPIFPLVAGVHLVYYALPIARGGTHMRGIQFSSTEILAGGLTVALYLLGGLLAWRLCARGRIPPPSTERTALVEGRIQFLIWSGLLLGIAFFSLAYTDWLSWTGTLYGTIRQIATMAASLGCFMFGYALGTGRLRTEAFALGCVLIGILVGLAWGTLFLVGGIMFLASTVLAYSIVTRRIPWKLALVLLSVTYVLHAGKADLRDKYWIEGSTVSRISILEVPGMFVEWTATGIESLTERKIGRDESLLERASLLQIVIHARQSSPEILPFLMGETYLNVFSVLVPRFINPEKVATQVSQARLNIYYGLQTEETAALTSIGWGLIAEAYANFGEIGVFVMGLVVGTTTGLIGRLSAGAPLLSVSGISSIVTLMVMLNLEADMVYIVSNLWQAIVAGLLFLFVIRFGTRPG